MSQEKKNGEVAAPSVLGCGPRLHGGGDVVGLDEDVVGLDEDVSIASGGFA